MLEQTEQISALLLKYLSDELEPEEREELESWAGRSDVNRQLMQSLNEREDIYSELKLFHRRQKRFKTARDRKFQKTLGFPHPKNSQKRVEWQRWVAACTVLLLIALAIYLIISVFGK